MQIIPAFILCLLVVFCSHGIFVHNSMPEQQAIYLNCEASHLCEFVVELVFRCLETVRKVPIRFGIAENAAARSLRKVTCLLVHDVCSNQLHSDRKSVV